MNTFNEDLQKQIDEIKGMIAYNIKKQAEYIAATESEKPMTERQYISMIARTGLLMQCVQEVESLNK